MEKMLINATDSEEVRVALIKDDKLFDLDIECPAVSKKKGNIYKATVTRREPSLDAVFVEYGSKRQGFLPLKEIAPEYFNPKAKQDGNTPPPITELVKEGQQLLIQIEKEERGNKGAALTTFITLAGCYLVLMPNSPRAGGISRRIEGEDRDALKTTLNSLDVEENMGVIIRTAGVGKKQEELQADLNMLQTQWHAIQRASKSENAPCLIHKEGDVIIRSIRDNLRKSITEIIIDDQITYIKAKRYIEQIKPEFLPHIKLYNSAIPLFTLHQVESQIETAYRREVPLPSGGSLVIDRTEALVSIDINSAKATSGAGIESTAVNTNLEAADEIAKQLRLRDLGGLIVIDFIDMSNNDNQRQVEARLKEALRADRARIQVGRISRFGLLEMSRQRLRLSLGESVQGVCPRCEGRGVVRNIQSHSLSIMRVIEEEAINEKTAVVQMQLPAEMAAFIVNEKREAILNIEKRHQVSVVIIPNPYMQLPQYKLSRLSEAQVGKNQKPSYSLIEQPDVALSAAKSQEKMDIPAVKPYADQYRIEQKEMGFFRKLWRLLGQSSSTEKTDTTEKSQENKKASSSNKPAQRRHPHSTNRRRRPQQNKQQSGSGSQQNKQQSGSGSQQNKQQQSGSGSQQSSGGTQQANRSTQQRRRPQQGQNKNPNQGKKPVHKPQAAQKAKPAEPKEPQQDN